CTFCYKSFVKKSHFNSHLQLHSNNNEIPFKCSICNKSFTQKSHLTEHLYIHI
ncbi:hypothetical protein L9F63_023205, partial [Diploptera punctata]